MVTNLWLICFISEELDFTFLGLSDTYFQETLTALILFLLLFIAVFLLHYCIASQPRKIQYHIERTIHIENSIKKIGDSIDRYLDGLSSKEITEWTNWPPTRVAYYLRETVYKNPDEFRQFEHTVKSAKFNGRAFLNADEHALEKKLLITDHQHKKFILNARRVLQEQVKLTREQDGMLYIYLHGI